VAGHASLFTTGDLARFARMMLNGGELDGVRLLKPEKIQLMTSVHLAAEAVKDFDFKHVLGALPDKEHGETPVPATPPQMKAPEVKK
jgi:CubicO group peptidase (beta-lactamase class C family)